jgi:FMN phosphatase YigB (HAD superfamily)
LVEHVLTNEETWLKAAVAADARTIVLVGAAGGDALGALLGARTHLTAIVLEPDPRAADALRTRFAGRSALSDRLTVLAGPNYAGNDTIAERFPDAFRAPVIVEPTLAARHPREVARARSIAARFGLTSQIGSVSARGTTTLDGRLLTLARLASSVSPTLDGARVLSLDAFDTLILRAVADPRDVFGLVAKRAREHGLIEARITPSQFTSLRRTAEERARLAKRSASGSTEVTLREIYRAWPGVLPDAAALSRLELQIEGEVVYAHPGTLALVEEARARGLGTALVSDTYFSHEELAALLAAAGISPRLFDVILTSSDAESSKHDGRLFDRLLAQWPDTPAPTIVHVGDHPHADGRQAERAGLTPKPHDTGRAAMAGALRIEALRHGPVLPELTSLRASAGTIDRPADADAQWFFALGAGVLGPALAAFADWIVAEAVRDGIRSVRPLMREGALFSDLLTTAARARGLDLDVAPLYVSRSATWLASLEAFEESAIRKILSRRHLTIAEVMNDLDIADDLGMSPVAPFAACTLGEASAMRTPGGLSLAELFGQCLSRQSVTGRVARTIAHAKDTLRSYLEDGLGPARQTALVDLGFRCSIGQAIEDVSRGTSDRSFHHFLLFATESVAELWARGMDVRVFGAGPIDDADVAGAIARHPAVIECLLTNGGTTLRYERNGNVVEPVRAECLVSETQRAATRACQDGIKRFQEYWLDWSLNRRAHGRQIASNRRALVLPIHRLVTLPTADEVRQLGSWLHEQNEGGQSTQPLANVAALSDDVSPDEFLRDAMSGSQAFGQSWLWPAAVCEARWPGLLEQRWRDAAGTLDGAPPVMPALAARMRRAGVTECTVWGAGEAGIALIRALRREEIVVTSVTDSNPTHWRTTVENVPVIAPSEACVGGRVFAIGSCAFAAEIAETIRARHQERALPVTIFSPLSENAE